MANENIKLINGEKMEEDEANVLANQVIISFVPRFVLSAIIDMGVLQIIHDHAGSGSGSGSGGLSPTELATRLQTQNSNAPVMLDRMLRLLTTYSVVRCVVVTSAADGSIERRYESSPLTKCFVPNDDQLSLAPILSMQTNKVFLECWTKLKEAVLEGEGDSPFQMLHGMHVYEYSRIDPDFNETFNKAMNGLSTITMKRILVKYQGFNDIQRLVDVGGGHGHNIALITSKYSSIKGINFDLPHVIEQAPRYSGVEHIGGDMFENIPNGDAIFLKWILHNWSDEECIRLLKNCYKCLPENGKVIVVENMILDEPDTSDYSKLVSIMDVTMMTQISNAGKERTVKEFESLAKAAGFCVFKLVVFVSNFWVMEFYKN